MDKTVVRAVLESAMKVVTIFRNIAAISLIFPAFSMAQVPVDEDGNVIGSNASSAAVMPLGEDDIPLLTPIELQELVGPVALYPDDLLAVVLPASAYPLQIAAAARFLDERADDPGLEPDPTWDDSVVALLNYPEVVELLNEDLDWTWRLGEAVVAQQADVVAAVEAFRDRAYAAGNLKSDEYQTVAHDDGAIRITPVADDAIYVPYYEPARVVTYQVRPAYFYYPRPCPVYYYPYAAGYSFHRGFFWGVTTAYTIGWRANSLHVFHHSYRGHPYYGRHYWNDWWYRRPSINIYNTTYVTNYNAGRNRYIVGDRWRARTDRREYVIREGYRDRSRQGHVRNVERRQTRTVDQRVVNAADRREVQRETIRFRERPETTTRRSVTDRAGGDRRASNRQPSRTAPSTTRDYVKSAPVRERDERRTARTRDDASANTNRRSTPPRATTPRTTTPSRRNDARTVTREPRSLPRRDVTPERRATPTRQPTTRSTPQRENRQAPQREQRSVPQRTSRAVPQRESRPVPQRSSRPAPQRETRAAPQRSSRPAPQRESRPAPPQRESRAAPQRENRSAPERESRSRERQSKRR